jgi:hypothetical protein
MTSRAGKKKKYIFRWKKCGTEVSLSRGSTEESVWQWAIANLRPASMTDDGLAERLIRRNGEVVEVKP